jgi:hypothetical protein
MSARPGLKYRVDATAWSVVAVCKVCGERALAGSRDGGLSWLAGHCGLVHEGLVNTPAAALRVRQARDRAAGVAA